MAFHDWNHNGKKDAFDDFIEYKIYNDSINNSGNNYSGNKSNAGELGGCCAVFFIVLAALAILGMIGSCFN